jgi:hypothetical protein
MARRNLDQVHVHVRSGVTVKTRDKQNQRDFRRIRALAH